MNGVIDRLDLMELRIERCLDRQLRWMVALVLPIYAVLLGSILAAAIAILGRLP
jgi:hypothetical protein